MSRESVLKYVSDTYGTSPEYPWANDNESAVLRHSENTKWYGLVIRIPRSKIGLPGDDYIDVLNVKCDPLISGSFKCMTGISPAYHMNKEKWISIALDGTVEEETVIYLIDLSYQLTLSKPKRAKRKNPEFD